MELSNYNKDLQYITVDSGENSNRTKYIEDLLKYYNYVKGKPIVALSQVNPNYTKNYLLLLPSQLRTEVLSVGIFHTYLRVTSKVRETINELYTNNDLRQIINQLGEAVNTLTMHLIKLLNNKGITVLLDRSILTNYAYTSVLNAKAPSLADMMIKRGATIDHKSIFIQSEILDKEYDKNNKIFYNILGSEFNIKITNWYKALAQQKDNVYIVPSDISYDKNLKGIINFLNLY